MAHRDKLAQDLKRFAVEALCLLLMLQGFPAHALQSAQPATIETATEASPTANDEATLDTLQPWASQATKTAEPQSKNRLGTELGPPASRRLLCALFRKCGDVEAFATENTRRALDQPWASALGLMLGLSVYAIPQGQEFDDSPPDPPTAGDQGPTKTEPIDPDSLSAILAERDTLTAIPLLPGFNLVSLPKVPPSSDPADVLAPIAGTYTKAFAFDGCAEGLGWQTYDPNDPAASDLTEVGTHLAVQIRSTTPTDLPVEGLLADSTTMTLCAGWNLIGYPAAQPRHVLNVFAPIRDKLLRIFEYDPFDPEDPWDFWDREAPNWANHVKFLRPGYGYWVLVSEDVTFEIKNVGTDPTASFNATFTAPQDLDVITAPTDIFATIESDLLDSWTLRYRAIGDPDWIELASRPYPPAPGEKLATFDPTLLLNGLYELELMATDLAGRQVTDTLAVVVEGQMKIGHFTLSFIDLAVPVSGLDIEVVRTYDSRQRHSQGDFGQGWTLDIRQGSYRNNRPPGDGWRIPNAQGPWGLPCSVVQETKSHLTTVRLSDQEVYRFRLVLQNPSTVIGGCYADAVFEWVDGPLPGTTLEILGNSQVFAVNGSDEVVVPDTQEPFVPEDVKLTTRDGRIFHLDLADGVTHLEDLNGNFLEITPEGITHSSGQGIDFERDGEGRITKITDPMGNANRYEYDEAGDLATFTDRADATTRFTYKEGHYLEDIENALGVRAVRTEYDREGRVRRMIDAAGKVVKLKHDLDARQETVTNRLGFVRILEYDGRGNVIRETDELGNVTVRTFDGDDRLLSETDPLGNTTTSTYDADGDLTTITDPLGNVTRLTYDGRGNPLTITDPRGSVTTFGFDGRGNLVSATDAFGAVAAFAYDTRGLLLTETDPLGHVTAFAYDTSGQPTAITDALGVTTTTTFDANGNPTSRSSQRTQPDGTTEDIVATFTLDPLGRVLSMTDPLGATTSTTYDTLGNILGTTDALGRVTTTGYDARGQPTATTYADGTGDARIYDAEGRLTTVTDRAGRATNFVYDAADRQIETLLPDGASRQFTYDAAGRLLSTIDALGQTTLHTYDAAGRRTSTTDPLGNTTASTFDAAGNLVTVTDALGQSTSFVYDALGRLTRTTLPDGTGTTAVFDALGRPVAEIDAADARTEFSYDALGRLTQVEDALDGLTRYAYDEQGNRISQSDANGHTTRFEFDALGRQTARTLPGGARESFSYNAVGNRIARTDFGGATTTYGFDPLDRLTRRTGPDGSAVAFTYTATGRRATMSDARGTTSYTYDARDRRIAMTTPEGWSLRSQWDAEGRRTALTLDLGDPTAGGLGTQTTTYGYDPAGRLTTVTDARGGVSTHAYDALGRQTTLTQPNGVATTRGYDPAGRLLSLETTAPGGEVLQSYAYTLGPAGNRQAVVEHDGTRRSWTYDPLYRLTAERVTDTADALVYEHRFTYDAVGNRLALERIDSEGTSQLSAYQYDTRDRLLSETAAGISTTYVWDANGNLTSMTEPGGTTSYGWDSENRLIAATLPEGTELTNVYDGDGVWVARSLQRPGEAAENRGLLADTTEALSQVVAEFEDEALAAEYIRGGRLLGVLRSGAQRAVHVDGLGSVRALSDEGGAAVDRYSYEAFGELRSRSGEDPNPFRFAGESFDSTLGLAHNRARWMDSGVGRFVSLDTGTPTLYRPASLNTYVYAENDPLRRVDPLGTTSILSLSISFAVATGILTTGYSLYRGASPGQSLARGAFVAALTFLAIYYVVPAIEGLLSSLAVAAAGGGAIQGLYGTVSVEALRRAAASGGPSTTVLTRLNQFPQAGRALSVSTGSGAEALTQAARAGGQLYRARIPNMLIRLMEEAGLVQRSTTLMGGTFAEELRFAPQVTHLIVHLFEAI